ncbi:MAG: hypothetical protein L0206_26070, partial [Actinobacteria bacterium]|nr:hypothetical protein [Actinomycetota bacterium]
LFVPGLTILASAAFMTLLDGAGAATGAFFLAARVAGLACAVAALAAVIVTFIYGLVLWKQESVLTRLTSGLLYVFIVGVVNAGIVVVGLAAMGFLDSLPLGW